MALDPRELLRTAQDESVAPLAPLTGTRVERLQRLQVGLFGLGTMILLVGLANIIQTSAQQNQAAAGPEDVPAVGTEDVPPPPRDPLVDAGVVPNLPVETDPQGDAAGSAAQSEPAIVPRPPAQN